MKPRLFIGSSVEGLNIAYAIQQNLHHQAEIIVWDQGVFELSKTTIESLINILENSDFGIFVFSPDDDAMMRGEEKKVIRDNVLFELGLFIGKLGRNRSFFIVPENTTFHLPTDLLGITPGKYEVNRSDGSHQAATGVFSQSVRESIKKFGRIDGGTSNSTKSTNSKLIEDNKKEDDWTLDFINESYKKGIDKLKKAIKKEKIDKEIISLKSWISHGNFQMNIKEGLDSFEKLIQQYPESPIPQIRKIQTLMWGDHLSKLNEIIDESLNKFLDNDNLKTLKSDYLIKIGKKEEAIQYYRKLFLESEIISPIIITNLFDLLLEKGEKSEAHKIIHNAFLLNPKNKDILYRYFKLADDLEMNEIALFLITKLIDLDSKNQTYWVHKGNTCLNLELDDYCLTSYEKGKELANKKEAWIYSNIGNINKNKGFLSLSIDYFNQALEIDSESEYAHSRLSQSIKLREEEKKKYSKALGDGRKKIYELVFKDKEQSK